MSICKEDAGPSLKAAMPTKIAEFLAIGRPVVVNTGLGDCDELLAKNGAGVIISRNDDLKLKAKELIELIHDKKSPQRCRNLAESNFDLNKGVRSYLDSYDALRTI
jgi:glycosyltransferase involved in cell wall biosynthesis